MFDVEENTVYHNLLISPAMSNQSTQYCYRQSTFPLSTILQ